MVFTDVLRAAASSIWEAQLNHPFVRGLADGSLETDRFKRWVRQDYLYLKEFARVFAWAVAKADSLESMSWYAQVLHLTLNTEMALHRQYAARFDITTQELEAETMWPTTRAYTDFLVRTAAAGDMAKLVAALLPCAWGYAFIARELARQGRPDDARYAEWIDQYVSPDFVQASEWLKVEMNRLAEGKSAQERRDLVDLFVLSSQYEWQFWEMCWAGEQWQHQADVRPEPTGPRS